MGEKKLDKEIEFIEKNKVTLLKGYANKFLLVHNQKVINSFDEYNHAAEDGIRLFGIDTLQASGMDVARAGAVAGTAMAWYAIFNGLGRITWGKISDTIGPEVAIFLMCFLQGFLMLTF